MTRIKLAMTERLKAVGLSVPQLDVLSTLTEQEGISQQELAIRLYVTKGNISGLLDRLVLAGLVERRSIAADKRSHSVFLTPAGRRLAEKGMKIHARFIDATLGQLHGPDLAQFERLLMATRDRVRDETGPGQTVAHASSRSRSNSSSS